MRLNKAHWMNILRTASAAIALLVLSAQAGAQIISLNFSENSGNQGFAGGELIGPLSTDSTNWNTTNGAPDLAAGSLTNLIDSLDGSNTGASVSWSSSNVWFNGDGTGNDEQRLAVGYLDDGAPGVSATFSNIPYTNYRVYGLLASDQGTQYDTLDFTVNGNSVFGAATAPAYGSMAESNAQTGNLWSLADGTNRGNYWTTDTTGSTLTITGQPRNGAQRASITAIIIEDLDAVIFDPTLRMTIDRDTGNVTLTNFTGVDVDISGLGLLSDNGTWNTANWNSITTTYDEGGTVSDDEWLELARTSFDLSESTLGSGTLAHNQTIDLGTSLWTKFPGEADITLEYLDANTDEVIEGEVDFVDSDPSNGVSPYALGDLNFDGVVDALDWPTQRDNYRGIPGGLSPAAAYQLGDQDGDGDNDLDDLNAFKVLFEAANGAGSFAALVSGVPEPSSAALLLILSGIAIVCRRFARPSVLAVMVVAVSLSCLQAADAQESISINFRGGTGGNGAAVDGPAGSFGSSNWNNFLGASGTAAQDIPELVDQDGIGTGAGVTWSANTTWGNGPVDTENAKLLSGYLDDNGAGGVHVQVASIPAAAYDVTIYFNHDGQPGDTGIFDIDVNGNTFVTTGAFTQPQAGVIDAGNSVTVTGLSGTLNLDAEARTANSISNISGIEISAPTFLDASSTVLTLEVDASNGKARILNNNQLGSSIGIDFFEITSSTSALNEAGWSPLGSGTNDGSDWEVLGNGSDDNLAQYFLDGEQGLTLGQTLSLGTAYKLGQGEQTLEFRYQDTTSGLERIGNVVFTTIAGLDGDFNNDGSVDAIDYALWRENLGAPDESSINNNGDGGGVTSSDYDLWKENFGNSAGAGAGAAIVPEPSAALLLLAACSTAILPLRKRRTKGVAVMQSNSLAPIASRTSVVSFGLIVAWAIGGSTALATVTNDREYRFGDPNTADSDPNVGNVMVMEGLAMGFEFNNSTVTGDETGPSGAFLDLEVFGPTYTDTSSKPGGLSGDFGARFDGDNDYLSGTPLNRPDRLAGPTQLGDDPPLPPLVANYPFNYDTITARGLQMWVFPDSAAVGDGRQGVIQDTSASGGVSITADGKWTQTNSGHIGADVGEATVDVVGDTWHHVMHHLYPQENANQFLSVVYVNGMAVSVNLDGVGPVDAAPGTVLLVGAEDTGSGDPHTPNIENHFQGVIDDIEMYVFGDNSSVSTSPAGQDYGTFNLFTDNDWIAAELAANHPGVSGAPIPGDVDLDGDVDDDDISDFIDGWRMEKRFQGAHGSSTAGDFETWTWGDSNLDGVVNFSDWALLRANHPMGEGLNLAQLLAGRSVPEPMSFCLMAIGLGGLVAGSRRR